MTYIPHWLEKRYDLTPEKTAIQLQDRTKISFLKLRQDSLEMAGKLNQIGISPNDHVALLSKNSYEMVTIIHAITYLQATVVLLNTRLTANELFYQYEDSESSFFLYQGDLEEKGTVIQKKHPDQMYSIQTIKQQPSKSFVIPEEINLEDTFTIIYTSGTTGFPKGVQLTYGNHYWSAASSALNLGLYENDRWLAMLPLFHVSGLSILVRSLLYGMPVHLHESFNLEEAFREITEEGITIASVVTIMLEQMVDQLGHQTIPDTLRCFLLGGGPAPKPLLERCKSKDIPVFQSYGMTETASQIVTLSPQDALRKLGSAGKPLFPAQLRIQLEDGGSNRPHETGEIMVKGPMVTTGYYKRKEANRKSFDQNWLKTGDLGYLDEDGYLYVVDRRKDLIISGGENVYPAEIESVLKERNEVQDAGVVGIEDDKWGQVPVAFIVGRENQELDKDRILKYAGTKLASYKVPKEIYFVDILPRNASKKLLRSTLLEWTKGIQNHDES
ncbi:o-succinylbenzoate--CoA ligase [Virgibacillus sp. MSP4-1]|uniref:o-succinylbenzoate--CoA ligase n=1 Tax=Virgibacillus sp. MSP4-1 TaxID=2700081 RepID=UPI0003A45E77|nr:o-succinylbenzoate--CoA ligase [Virgibacillus sp. MSP4-1]QHS23101.1 o-succinylbenzoate--CoA ligase [Virgibacillus sp. MSP4-1]